MVIQGLQHSKQETWGFSKAKENCLKRKSSSNIGGGLKLNKLQRKQDGLSKLSIFKGKVFHVLIA